jgi:glutathione peroxidase
MKKILLPFLFTAAFAFAQCPESLHSFTVQTINGDTLPLSSLAGKKVMVVNTASYCGYTPQYADLQQLYSTYGGPTFEIIGFPCNDFGNQEPGGDETIDSFCVQNYGITFQMMHKISITAPDTVDVYKWLQLQSRNCVANAAVTWNFNKYLVDEAGNWIAHYSSPVSPLSQFIIDWILSPNTTGISSPKQDDLISIYPVPAENFLTIKTGEKSSVITVDIYNLIGERILQAESSNQECSINVKNLAPRIYFVTVANDGEIIRKKFVKQ